MPIATIQFYSHVYPTIIAIGSVPILRPTWKKSPDLESMRYFWNLKRIGIISNYVKITVFITSLARWLCLFIALLCLSVFLFVYMLTTLLKKLWTYWDEILWRCIGWWKKYQIFVAIQIIMLTVQSVIQQLLNKLWSDFDEIFRIALQWYKLEFIQFSSDHHAGSPTRKLGQCGGKSPKSLRSLSALFTDDIIFTSPPPPPPPLSLSLIFHAPH